MKKFILAIVIILFVLKCGCDSDATQHSLESSSGTTKKFLAYNYAEEFVKKRLKAPGTAEFPKTSEKINHITSLGGEKYMIDSWVDSQNGFGALIRSRFTCKVIFENGSVRAENLIIE